MRKKSELLFSLLLVPIDVAAILSAFVAAYAIRVKVEAQPVAHPFGIIFFLKIFLIILPFWILFFALCGLYNQSSLRSRVGELARIFVAVSGGIMFMIVVDFASRTPIFPSKAVPVYTYVISLGTVTLGRVIVRALQRSLFRLGVGTYKSMLVGSGPLAKQLADSLADTASSGYNIVAVIDGAQGARSRMNPLPVYPDLDTYLQDRHHQPLDEIIQADSSLDSEAIFKLVEYAANQHIIYRFIPNQFGIFATHSELTTLAGMPMVAIKRTPLDGWGRIVKRGFDVVASSLGLVVLSPVLLLVALTIKVFDPGPALYRHKRLSRTGKAISMYKFRTMRQRFSAASRHKTDVQVFAEMDRPDLVEEFERDQKVKDDPRVSRIGAFLRRSSLDELPQLINIWRGDLSLVGPRPIVEAELDKYGTGRTTLLALRPGLTGLWQVSGRNDISYDERVKLDIYYVENWSLWLDIRIIVRTLLIIATRRGAY